LRSVTYGKTLDVYEFCSDELKKSLDCGRDFEAKLLEEEEKLRQASMKEDVVMTEESKEPPKESAKPKLVGLAAKNAMK
jgi:hypothetical protein